TGTRGDLPQRTHGRREVRVREATAYRLVRLGSTPGAVWRLARFRGEQMHPIDRGGHGAYGEPTSVSGVHGPRRSGRGSHAFGSSRAGQSPRLGVVGGGDRGGGAPRGSCIVDRAAAATGGRPTEERDARRRDRILSDGDRGRDVRLRPRVE